MTANLACTMCNADMAKNCSKCQSVRYCGKECQLSDWPVHKHFCAALPFPTKNAHQSKESITAILFDPATSPKPQIVQVPLDVEDFGGNNLPNIDPFMNTPDMNHAEYMTINPETKKPLPGKYKRLIKRNLTQEGPKMSFRHHHA